jgi:hypothetical protein
MRAGGGGMHFSGGGNAMRAGVASPAFRGAQANVGAVAAPSHPIAAASGNFAGRSGQFAQGGYRNGFRDHGRHFGRGVGFAAGLAAGSALGYGYGGYYDPNYYDDYAYNGYGDNGYYDNADAGYIADPGYVVSNNVDPAYCAQRYKSYDPASGTYLGYDGLRHPCGQ